MGANLDVFDVEELACEILELDYDEIDADTNYIESMMDEKYGMDLEMFADIINRIMPLIDIGESPITESNYKGFSSQKGVWLCKMKI